jgi:hypothetical protein
MRQVFHPRARLLPSPSHGSRPLFYSMEHHAIPYLRTLRREHVCALGSAVAMAQGPSPQEDSPMLHAVPYPRDLIVDPRASAFSH